jgi:plasmid maintenance system antidote protein VapI
LESTSANRKITFSILRTRLINLVNARIQNGHFTERGLARMLGISQSQMHNVLKGARTLRPELADRLAVSLEITLADLFETSELREQLASRSAESNGTFGLWNSTGAQSESESWNRSTAIKKSARGLASGRSEKQQAS